MRPPPHTPRTVPEDRVWLYHERGETHTKPHTHPLAGTQEKDYELSLRKVG